jgi:uncharacterized protein (TIGR02466 family)
MEIFRDSWWATPVWRFDIPIQEVNYNKVANECYLERSKSEGRVRSNRNGWQSDDIYATPGIPNISNLIKTVEMYSKNIFQDYGVKKEINLRIDSSWININFPGSYNIYHVHPNCALSGIYYANAPKNSGSIIMHNNSITSFINESYLDANNRDTYHTVTYEPINGRVIIFPPWLPHSVETNNSNEDRVSIAFNFGIKQ